MVDKFIVAPSRIKRVGATKPFTIDFKRLLRSYWIAGRRYTATVDFVRAPSLPGFAYQCTVSGEVGAIEPAWPRTLGGAIVDGSITWTCVAAQSNAVDTIGAVTWSQVSPPDAALTISNQSNTIEEATAQFAAGTAGSTYRIRCSITTATPLVYVVEFDLEVQ